MYKEIEIGGSMIPMSANATTPIRYKQVFQEDFYTVFSPDLSGGDYVEVAGKLAFIMMQSAAKADMNKVNVDQYWEWLETLPPLAIANASADIINFYASNEATTVEAKKNTDRQNESTQ